MYSSPRKRTLWMVFACTMVAMVAADDPRKPPAPPVDAHQREAAEVAEALRESWPDHPEWVNMLTSILAEEPMSPSFGWFRTAVSQTRFDWDAAQTLRPRWQWQDRAVGVRRQRCRLRRASTAITTGP